MAAPEPLAWGDVDGLRVGRFGGKVNTTCIVWRIGDTLVDTGPPNQWREVARFCRRRPPARVAVSHHHEDHAGNLARLAAAYPAAEVLAPRRSLAALQRGFPLQPYRRIIWGTPRRTRARPLPEALVLGDGSRLEPVLLPGHSPDMTCFLERRRRLLFSADLYVARRQRYLRADEDLAGILASLRRALTLDFDTLLCSHRGVVENGRQRLREKLDYFEQLCRQAVALRAAGLGPGRIARRLLGREGTVGLVSGLHYSKRNLIVGCLEAAAAERPAQPTAEGG